MTDQIQRELVLDADPDVVWRAITEPESLSEWLAEVVALDPRPGGEARFVVDGEVREGWVEEVRPPREGRAGCLAFWWQADDEPASRVALEVDGVDGGARLRVTEARPLEVLDLVGIPLAGGAPGSGGPSGPSGGARGPMLVAA